MLRELEIRFATPAKRTTLPTVKKPSARKLTMASVPPVPATKRDHPAAVITNQHALAPPLTPPSASAPNEMSIETLMESAKKIAREGNRPQLSLPKETTNSFERPILPQLARALHRDPPGETRLANGMIKVVTTTGATYCLQPLPKFARGGSVEPTIIPTNCPS